MSLPKKILFLLLIISPPALSQLLIVQSSDEHGAIKHLPRFSRAYGRIVTDFLNRHPQGQVLRLSLGDTLTSALHTNQDKAEQLTQWTIELSKVAPTIFVPGNHDADFGNEVFFRQMKQLHEAGITLLAANAIPAPEAAAFFSPFHDIVSPDGKKRLRFIGFTLQDFLRRSTFNPHDPQHPFIERFLEYEPLLQTEIANAQTDGVTHLIPLFHDSHAVVSALLSRIQSPLILFGMAAHDHLVEESANVFDSGSRYKFRVVELDENFKIVKNHFYDREEQKKVLETVHPTHPALDSLADRVSQWLADFKKAHPPEVLLVTSGRIHTKLQMKEWQQPLGYELANSMRGNANDIIARLLPQRFSIKNLFEIIGLTPPHVLKDIPVAGWFNSSSCRLEECIEAGEIDIHLDEEIYPYDYYSKVFVGPGAVFQQMYETLRTYRAQSEPSVYTPQLSDNLRFKPGTLELEINTTEGWIYVRDVPLMALGLDSWLSSDGYKIWQDVMKGLWEIGSTYQRDVIKRHLYPQLVSHREDHFDPCLAELVP